MVLVSDSKLTMKTVALVTLFLIAVACGLSKLTRRSTTAPPGPPSKPLIGNLLDWPWDYGWLRFTEWAKTYG